MTQADDIRWMSYALGLGARGQGTVWPNPAVGCVIVRGARVIGRGWTQPGGRPHAEVMALRQCGGADSPHSQGRLNTASGATAYVTLEPCAHTGQTPPCTKALIAAGIARVVIAVGDRDPRVAGRGIAQLEAAGITVETGVLAAQAIAAHQGFFQRIKKNRPFVSLKLASSLDGRIATRSGDSQWITGAVARRSVHAMRARHDAVWVGAGTARADLPSLTVRGFGAWNDPVRIVSSTALDIPRTGPLADTAKEIPVWLLHGPNVSPDRIAFWRQRGARLFEGPQHGAGLDLAHSLEIMAQQGLTRVFCEGGGQLAGALLQAGLVDQLICFNAGVAIGADGRASLAALDIDVLTDAPRFELSQTQVIGADLLSIWKPRPPTDQTP